MLFLVEVVTMRYLLCICLCGSPSQLRYDLSSTLYDYSLSNHIQCVCVCVCVVFDLPISYTFRMHTTCCHVHGPKMSSVSQSMTTSALGSRGPTLQLTPPLLPCAMHMAGEGEFTVFNHHLMTDLVACWAERVD